MTSEGLGEMFEGDSADTLTGKFPLVPMGGRAEGLECADPGARTPIGVSGNLFAHLQKTGQTTSKDFLYLSQQSAFPPHHRTEKIKF